ncbi:MAG: FapA family protein [Lachnospiraceae bacterium]|nr:FapA family protein [Lachnospiraceae bacterium]
MKQTTSGEIRKNYLSQGYNRNQIECLMEGRKKGVDVSVYENPAFFSLQMNQILQGLLSGVDVSLYAKTEYDWFQMEEIRKGLERNLDVTKYMDPDMDFRIMRELRKGLEINIDLTSFTHMEPGKIRQIRLAFISKVSILDEIKEGYDDQQLDEIRQALEKGIRVQDYITPEFRQRAIKEIVLGLEEGIDVSLYAKIYYSWKQMQQLRLGIEHRVDITKYSNRLYSDEQMQEIRLGLEAGVNVDAYRRFMYTAKEMRSIRIRLVEEGAQEVVEEKPEESNETVEAFQNARKLNDLEVHISEDGMEAYIDMTKQMNDWEQADILKTLYIKGIRNGIISDKIEAISKNKIREKKVMVAKGVRPQHGADGYYEYFFRTDISNDDKQLPDKALDLQNLEWYETVKKGQKLAVYHSPTEGVSGATVSGATVPARKGKELPILKGRGFTFDADGQTYFAAQDGKITFNEDGIFVTDIHELKGVTSTQGNLYFDGMVIVKGPVGNGTCLEASDDIIIEGYVETATIKSGGSIIIKQGVNASNTGCIHAKKAVLAKYFESANIFAGQRLQADYCMNSDIVTEGRVVLIGENGSLIGGSCTAQEGMIVQNLGNRAGIVTAVSIGIEAEVQRELDKIKEETDKILEDLERLKSAQLEIIDKYPPEVRNTQEIFLKIGSAIFTKNKQLEHMTEKQQQLKNRMTQIRYAGIRVLGDIFENVNVKIDDVRWVSRASKNVTLKRINKRISVYQH